MANIPDDPVLHFRRAEVHYERRVVAFFDVLGWRDKIEKAGAIPIELARLRNLVSFYSLIARRPLEEDSFRVSTFSDNVAVSVKPTGKDGLILLLGLVQMVATTQGFLLRGGITIGDVVHDDDVVFGPALNRAYDIERRIAVYPRIVIDPDQKEEFPDTLPLLNREDGLSYVDPFRTEPFQNLCKMCTVWRMQRGEFRESNFREEYEKEVTTNFTKMYQALQTELERPLPEKEWGKVAWLFDRMAVGCGVPERAAKYRRR